MSETEEPALTERQHYWLQHIQACEALRCWLTFARFVARSGHQATSLWHSQSFHPEWFLYNITEVCECWADGTDRPLKRVVPSSLSGCSAAEAVSRNVKTIGCR